MIIRVTLVSHLLRTNGILLAFAWFFYTLRRTPEVMYDISSCDDAWCIYRGILRSGGVYILAVDLGTAVEDLEAAHN